MLVEVKRVTIMVDMELMVEFEEDEDMSIMRIVRIANQSRSVVKVTCLL